MKTKRPKSAAETTATRNGVWYAAAFAALAALFWAYSPAMHTAFLFDDSKQQFAMPSASEPLSSWIGPVRPLLMFSYWVNTQISLQDTSSYHLFNILIHALTGVLVFLVIRRLLEWAGAAETSRTPFAAFGAFLFLLHPLQAESVAYISGRSDSLCGLFGCASLAAFLYRRSAAISWAGVASVVLLFGAAVLTKEQAVVLPVVFLLTDIWWNPDSPLRSVRANWKLYVVLAAGAAGGMALFWKLILGVGTAGSAGFAMKDFTWYQYLFTEFRAIYAYLFNFLLPVRLNVDWDFPISRTLFDRGAIFGLAGLLALAALAWRYRRSFPLAGYGYFLFLVLLAPTSSILPIKDPIADRRMYLPMLGLILIAIDFLRRVKLEPKLLATGAGVVIVAATVATHARAQVWSDPILLWQDTALKSPDKVRAHFQLAFAYFDQGRYDLAVAEFEKSASREPPTADLLVDWGLAYDGLNQPDRALEKLRQAAALEPTAHIYTQIGYVLAKRASWKEAMEAFDTAQKLDANFAITYMYKGQVRLATNEPAAAVVEFQHALALDPSLTIARQGLSDAQRQLSGPLNMRIGVNALYLIPGGVGGTEIYLRSLLTALAEIDHHNQYFVFTNRETGPDLVPEQANFTWAPQAVRAANRPARLIWEQTVLPLAVVRRRLDVLLNPGFTAPLLCACPQVTVFHDLQHKRHPEYFRWFDLPFWNFFLFWSITVSRRIVAVSGATADDLRRWYRLPPDKVRTVPSGVDPHFFDLAACRRPEPFLLAVSTLHPHKNLDGLLRAFAIFLESHPEYRLIVSGIHGFYSSELHALRERLQLSDRVEFPGWIPRGELYDLYARAAAFLYPSLFEGFGLPVLEALAAGVPSGCSGIEPMDSIAGDAALKFDPKDSSAIAAAMHRLVSDEELRRRLTAAGPKRAAEFSWRTTAHGILEALRSAC